MKWQNIVKRSTPTVRFAHTGTGSYKNDRIKFKFHLLELLKEHHFFILKSSMVITQNVKFEHLKWVKHDKIRCFAIKHYVSRFFFTKLATVGLLS